MKFFQLNLMKYQQLKYFLYFYKFEFDDYIEFFFNSILRGW